MESMGISGEIWGKHGNKREKLENKKENREIKFKMKK